MTAFERPLLIVLGTLVRVGERLVCRLKPQECVVSPALLALVRVEQPRQLSKRRLGLSRACS